jgi:hypothetical protein
MATISSAAAKSTLNALQVPRLMTTRMALQRWARAKTSDPNNELPLTTSVGYETEPSTLSNCGLIWYFLSAFVYEPKLVA